MKNLYFDARRGVSVPYEHPPAGSGRQLERIAAEKLPGACVGCGFEQNCGEQGCALLRKISRVVAVLEGHAPPRWTARDRDNAGVLEQYGFDRVTRRTPGGAVTALRPDGMELALVAGDFDGLQEGETVLLKDIAKEG